MELAMAVSTVGLFAAVLSWLRHPVTVAQVYRRIAGELILRATAREGRSRIMRDLRGDAMRIAGVE